MWVWKRKSGPPFHRGSAEDRDGTYLNYSTYGNAKSSHLESVGWRFNHWCLFGGSKERNSRWSTKENPNLHLLSSLMYLLTTVRGWGHPWTIGLTSLDLLAAYVNSELINSWRPTGLEWPWSPWSLQVIKPWCGSSPTKLLTWSPVWKPQSRRRRKTWRPGRPCCLPEKQHGI